jgi:predicted aldo/keto reductase-like oxidoreductase
MKTSYVDLWQVHAIGEMEEIDTLFGPGGAMEAFELAKKQGKTRFIGFTGHHDPHVHAEMLKRYDKWDTILMPLHPADPHYLSFEKIVLPHAVEQKLGIQAMKITANAKLLSVMSVRDCIRYALSLPVHCAAIGCTTIGQLEDDVRIAQDFRPLAETELAALRQRAERVKGPWLEDWKRNLEQAHDGPRPYLGG